MKVMMLKVWEKMVTFETQDGKDIAAPFVQLPSKKELPDYYDVIQDPMDFNKIRKKINSGR